MAQKTQTGALHQPRGWEGEWDGREVQKGGDICIPMSFMLRFDRKQQNSVKQLSFNNNNNNNNNKSILGKENSRSFQEGNFEFIEC